MSKVPWRQLTLPKKRIKLRVTRDRLVARNAECLFEGKENSQVFSRLNGITHLKGNYAIRLAIHGCANHPFYHIVVAKHMDERECEVSGFGNLNLCMKNAFITV